MAFKIKIMFTTKDTKTTKALFAFFAAFFFIVGLQIG